MNGTSKVLAAVALLGAGSLIGCEHVDQSPAITQTDQKLAQPAYWLNQPANASVKSDNYEDLWEACVEAARYRGFKPDLQDYREGILITQPLVSKQIFEVWRRDVTALDDQVESTLATTRRIIRFEITRDSADGGGAADTFTCVPKVLEQHYAAAERRITAIQRYREAFSLTNVQGSKERDRGIDIPPEYWYTTARDAAMEKQLAQAIESRVKDAVASR
jgi:hypothetical protein